MDDRGDFLIRQWGSWARQNHVNSVLFPYALVYGISSAAVWPDTRPRIHDPRCNLSHHGVLVARARFRFSNYASKFCFYFINFSIELTIEAIYQEKQANAAKSRFIANVSHGAILFGLKFWTNWFVHVFVEMRTPLTTIIGWTELLMNSKISEAFKHNLKVPFPSVHYNSYVFYVSYCY